MSKTTKPPKGTESPKDAEAVPAGDAPIAPPKEPKHKHKAPKDTHTNEGNSKEQSNAKKTKDKAKEKQKKTEVTTELDGVPPDANGEPNPADASSASTSSKQKKNKKGHKDAENGAGEQDDRIENATSHSKGFMSKLSVWKKKKDGHHRNKSQSDTSIPESQRLSPRSFPHDPEEEDALASLLVAGQGVAGARRAPTHKDLNAAEYLRAVTQQSGPVGSQATGLKPPQPSQAPRQPGHTIVPLGAMGSQASFRQSKFAAIQRTPEPFSDSQAHMIDSAYTSYPLAPTTSAPAALPRTNSSDPSIEPGASSPDAIQAADDLAAAAETAGDHLVASPNPVRPGGGLRNRNSVLFDDEQAGKPRRDSNAKPAPLTSGGGSGGSSAQMRTKITSPGGSKTTVIVTPAEEEARAPSKAQSLSGCKVSIHADDDEAGDSGPDDSKKSPFHKRNSKTKVGDVKQSSELGQFFYSRIAGESVEADHLRSAHKKEEARMAKKKAHDAAAKPAERMKFTREDGRFKYKGHVVRIPIADDKKDDYEIIKFSHNSWSGVRYYWVPDGQGILRYITGEVRYIGEWKKGVHHGQGEGSYEHKEAEGVYSGEWKNGKPSGEGCLITKRFQHDGGWSEGLRSGFGEYLKERLQYVGDWLEDQKHGYGIATYADGTRYEGEWEKDQRTGFGVCRYPDGSIYTGMWSDNLRHGEGTCIYANGNHFVGEWYKDMKQGKGTLYGALHQKLYEGNWWRNKRHGQGTGWFLDTGDRYEGEWFLGKQHGEGDWFGADGSSYKGSYVDGFRHGTGLVVYASGDRYVGDWARGIREGALCAYVYKDYGKFVGPFTADRAGGLGEYHTFANRKIVGNFSWDIIEDDNGRYTGLIVGGRRTGRGVQVYKNGDRYDGEWREDKRYGYGVMQYEDGGRYVGFWLKDERSKLGTYSLPNGEKYVGRWLSDKRHGTGTMIFENKDRLVDAQWVDDAPVDGHGIYVFANKSVYRGALVNGLPEGRGSLTLYVSVLLKERAEYRKKVGTHYFLKGERHASRTDPEVEDRELEMEDDLDDISAYIDSAKKNNKQRGAMEVLTPGTITFWREFDGGRMLDGPGLSIWDGNSYEGDFVGFERYGVGRMMRTSGETYFGQWKHDREWGIGEVRTRSADVYVGHWYNGFRNGVGSQSYDEGGTFYGKWMNDRRHGIGLFMWPDKTITTREYYKGEFVAKRTLEDSWVKRQLAQWGVEKFPELVRSLPFKYPKWSDGPMPDFYLEAVLVHRDADWENDTLTLDAIRSSRGNLHIHKH